MIVLQRRIASLRSPNGRGCPGGPYRDDDILALLDALEACQASVVVGCLNEAVGITSLESAALAYQQADCAYRAAHERFRMKHPELLLAPYAQKKDHPGFAQCLECLTEIFKVRTKLNEVALAWKPR